MHKMKNIRLQLVSDPDYFFEKGRKGGISNIFNWYSEANNKYLKSYDAK